MHLCRRFKDRLNALIEVHLPAAQKTVWDASGVDVFIESLGFTPSSGGGGDWCATSGFEGVMVANIQADDLYALTLDPLISILAQTPLVITADRTDLADGVSHNGRLTLTDMRNGFTETHAVISLRFNVKGEFARFDQAPQLPSEPSVGSVSVGAAP